MGLRSSALGNADPGVLGVTAICALASCIASSSHGSSPSSHLAQVRDWVLTLLVRLPKLPELRNLPH